MKFPTKDELELLYSPLRDRWIGAINRYWSEKYEEYKREQEKLDPIYADTLAMKEYNHV